MACLGALALATPASAQVVWEDFQGTQGILGTSNNDKAGPSYDNNVGYTVAELSSLRTIAANSANATRSGTNATINYRQAGGIAGGSVDAFATLCNTSNATAGTGYDGPGTGSACINDAQGRVIYALIKFPFSGNYNFAIAHDDAIDLDLSADYSNTNYKTAAYNMPVGDAPAYTADENTYDTLAGVFSTPASNACILMRLYWNNNGGINYLRLRWTRPNASGTGTTTEIVPAAYLFDPGVAANSTGCTAVTPPSTTSITVNKVIGGPGRADAADQFTVAIRNTAAVIQTSASTGGSGTGQQASTGGWLATAGTTYQVNDAMATGSTNLLAAAYDASIACTRNGTAFTPGGTAPTWTVTPAANQAVVCTITNARKSATLRLQKTWVNAVLNNAVTLPASTGFFSNTTAFNSVANTASESDLSGNFTVYVGEAGTLTAENFTTGTPSAYASVLGCSAGTLSGTNGQANNILTVPVAAAGATITCTYTNTFRPPLTFVKSSGIFSDPINGTAANRKIIPGGFITYRLTVTSPAAYTVTANSIFVGDAVPAQMRLFVGDIGGAGSGPVLFSDGPPASTLTYGFISQASTTDDLEYSNDGGLTWAYVPSGPSILPDGTDPNITHIRLNPKGVMAASSSFNLSLRMVVK